MAACVHAREFTFILVPISRRYSWIMSVGRRHPYSPLKMHTCADACANSSADMAAALNPRNAGPSKANAQILNCASGTSWVVANVFCAVSSAAAPFLSPAVTNAWKRAWFKSASSLLIFIAAAMSLLLSCLHR